MKFLHVLALGACVWLVGCAAPGSVSTDATGTPTASSTGQPGVMPPVEVTELHAPEVAALSAPNDLWERIRRGFAMPDLDTELVRKQEQWYVSRPDYIGRMVERSRLYLFHVVEELELRGMPTELALLPYIESAFNPQAISSAKAAGLWQFMPATGNDFELRQNMLRDDRRDVLASTRAALDYLQMLHDMFGDWHLALAAYNWGQGNVGRAIERNRTAGLPTGYVDLTMPAETANYVPKLQAVKNIIARPDALGAVLPVIGNHPFFDTVDITRDIDVEVAARLAEVRLEDFRALNPSQRKPIIFAAGTPQVLLPWDNAAVFKKNLAATDPATIASWTAWVAPATLPTREAAQRVGMDEAALRELNAIPRGMLIRKGSTLLVARNGHTPAAVASQVVDNAQLSVAPEVVLRRTTVRAQKGDTIARLAARYDLPAATVAGWNKASANTPLRAGRGVVVYLPVRASSTARAVPPARAKARRTGRASARRAAPAHARKR
ncbi:MAG TPA: transglycosylase SLT domain-containing protein [Ottowia sp.]|uniref:transglycosylase SLT domain-containing protein n=1 Tax=Ottowia sp. TaxID=1898956 RepID=UPI002BCCF700|nr:transglycosylase SLT domain-containing protein [Ottowia sp.]HMN21859.1 transglycosylase SLT domain-containing protein [Ottowia sp.]